MLVAAPKETWPGERRVPLVPVGAKKLVSLGLEVRVEAGMGSASGFADDEYRDAGAGIETDRDRLLAEADIVVRLRKPELDEITRLKRDCVHVSFLDPFNEKALAQALADARVRAISMEMIPRTTRAQKMDALSSQANLAGYVAVIVAAELLPKIFPMMMTPAGTIAPARVFVIGAGVAGLQAIATAKRLGARVTAFDTRPVVAEQVQSLGGRFLDIDLGDTGQTEQGYAQELTPEQLELQRQGMKRAMAQSDVVITTAQLFGRAAPRIITRDMVEGMQRGSVIVDMAVESGGNVEGSKVDEIVEVNDVKIIGFSNLPARVCRNASEMYSANVVNLLDDYWDEESKQLDLDPEDEIVSGCLITRDGEIVNETIKKVIGE